MKSFKNKVVVITGGATGIGKAMADRFGAESRDQLFEISEKHIRFTINKYRLKEFVLNQEDAAKLWALSEQKTSPELVAVIRLGKS